MFRDVHGARILGIKSIFFDSNQGTKTFENVSPDYRVSQFDDVLKGVAALS
jgi:putative hydrolase of the HAD superfamily